MKTKQCYNCGKILQSFNNNHTCSKCEDKLKIESITTSSILIEKDLKGSLTIEQNENSLNSNVDKHSINDKTIKAILQNMTVLCDSREQQNRHILEYFKAKGITYEVKGLSSGDYTFMIPSMPEHGITEPISFENKIFVERKNSLEELSGNMGENRERFHNEFKRADQDCRKILIIEKGSIDDILDGKYRTGFDAKAYLASLLSFKCKYTLDIHFVSRENIGKFIYATFYYHAREFLLGGGDIGRAQKEI